MNSRPRITNKLVRKKAEKKKDFDVITAPDSLAANTTIKSTFKENDRFTDIPKTSSKINPRTPKRNHI